MTSPLPSPFTDGQFVNKAQLDTVVGFVNTLSFGKVNSAGDTGSSKKLTNTSSGGVAPWYYTGSAANGNGITWTVPAGGRTYFVLVAARFVPATVTAGRYRVWTGIVPGGTIDTTNVSVYGAAMPIYLGGGTGDANSAGCYGFSVPQLSQGTYTTFPCAVRVNGGDVNDTATDFWTAVLDIGT